MPKRTLTAAEAARALGISLDTLRRWDKAGKIRVERDAANRRVVEVTEIERLKGVGGSEELSARNRFRGVVRSVELDGLLARVEIDVTEPSRVVAIITRESAEELQLRAGMSAAGSSKRPASWSSGERAAASERVGSDRRRSQPGRRQRRRGDDRAQARPVVLAAASLTEVLPRIAPDAAYSFGSSNSLAEQIRRGAPVDVYLSASPIYTQTLFREELTRKPVAFATNSLVVIVPRSNPAKIKTVFDLAKRPKLNWSSRARRCRSVSTRARSSSGSVSSGC